MNGNGNGNGTERFKAGVIFAGRRRPGFDMEWGRRMEERARAALRQAPFEVFEPSEKAVDDPSLRRAVAECAAENVDALVLLQATMSDARMAPGLVQLWPDPPVLWATPEKPDGDMISSCSLVGAHAWASTFRQMGREFELVYGDPDEAALRQRLDEALRLAATVRRLRSVKLGLVGGQAPGFFAMSADPFSLHHGLGVQLQTFTLTEFASAVHAFTEAEVAADVARVQALGLEHKDTTDADLPMSSRFYLAMRGLIDQERLDALALRCWPEMPNVFGHWPYLAIARLVDEGRAVACEGDADGALSAWVGESLGMGRCYLSDWLEHDRETITLWHGGAAPLSLSPDRGQPGAPRIARHFNSGKPAVVDAALREHLPVTICRLWRCEGRYHLTAREGRTIPPRRQLMGSQGVAQLTNQDPGEWFEELCHAGMPHHVAVFSGHHAARLARFARLLSIRVL